MSVLFCLSPGRVQRPLPEGEVQPPQGVCDPGLPDGPVCQPQAPAPQVKAGGRGCSPSGGSGGAPSLTGGQEAEAERVFVRCFIWDLVPALLLWFSDTDLQRMSISLFPLHQLCLTLSPHLSRGTENPLLVIIGTVPPPKMTPGPRKLVANKTLTGPLASWLPLTFPPGIVCAMTI